MFPLQMCSHGMNLATCPTCFVENGYKAPTPKSGPNTAPVAVQTAPVSLEEAQARSEAAQVAMSQWARDKVAAAQKQAANAPAVMEVGAATLAMKPRSETSGGAQAPMAALQEAVFTPRTPPPEAYGNKLWEPAPKPQLIDRLPRHPHAGEGKVTRLR